jgi:hypothetical protein
MLLSSLRISVLYVKNGTRTLPYQDRIFSNRLYIRVHSLQSATGIDPIAGQHEINPLILLSYSKYFKLEAGNTVRPGCLVKAILDYLQALACLPGKHRQAGVTRGTRRPGKRHV